MLTLDSNIRDIKRIGDATANRLNRLGISCVRDLLWYLPVRYEDLSNIVPIAKLRAGELATVRVRVKSITTQRSFRKRMLITELIANDAAGDMVTSVWFRQPFIARILKPGDEIYLSGKPQGNLLGMQFVSPMYEKVKEHQLNTAHIIPYYHLTEGLTHKQLRFLIQRAWQEVPRIPEDLPAEIVAAEKFLSLDESLREAHQPSSASVLRQAIQRLKFEELFWLQLNAAYGKKLYQQHAAPRVTFRESAIRNYVASLPFQLTADQKKSAWAILRDMERAYPMNRLIQGDVGSGKTVVASIALLDTVLNGYQGMLMAPTEVLALQHYQELSRLFASTPELPDLHLALLTAQHIQLDGQPASRAKILQLLADGAIRIIVGTHSLIQESIAVREAGLVIIDEQHRFGVEQRKRLTELNLSGLAPHLLSLTATPIPRTLALTLYGDLDVSSIKQKPVGRKPVLTKIVEPTKRDKAYQFIMDKARSGQQTFILCPLIDDSAGADKKAVLQEHARLQREVFPDLDVRFLHGKMKSEDKKNVIQEFKQNIFPILVTTSVIEVGIDIPNATIMVIEDAERFGLAQLHQFRGRVGRNSIQSYCLLFTSSPNHETLRRLKLFSQTNDGFALAEADLTMRGEGEVFGTRQSGMVNFKIATLRDTALIKKSRSWVDRLVTADTDLKRFREFQHRLERVSAIHWE